MFSCAFADWKSFLSVIQHLGKSNSTKIMRNICIAFILLTFGISALGNDNELLIKNATVFNSVSGKLEKNQDILIDKGIIVEVVKTSKTNKATTVINAKDKIVTAGFIDVHTHLTHALGDPQSDTTFKLSPDSSDFYRTKHANQYLPYGITAVRMVGEPENWIHLSLDWQKNPIATAPDMYTCGGALISKPIKNSGSYIGHAIVNDTIEAEKKVEDYYKLGIRDIKLYWRLRYPELKAVIKKANELKMNVCAHIDMNITTKDSLLKLGVKEFEHIHTIGIESVSEKEANVLWTDTVKKYNYPDRGSWFAWQMEIFNYLGNDNKKIIATINNLKEYNASLTPTIHIFALSLGLSYFKSKDADEKTVIDAPICDTRQFTSEQRMRCIKGFEVMLNYVKKMYDTGIQLNLGTDWAEGGKAALSEMLLLHKAGIPMEEILKIATINSAKAIGREQLYGSIEKGKRANLIIFDKNPLEDFNNLLSRKTIIKDGIVFNQKQ